MSQPVQDPSGVPAPQVPQATAVRQRRRWLLPFRIWGGWVAAIVAAFIGVCGQRQVVVVSNQNVKLLEDIARRDESLATLRADLRSQATKIDATQKELATLTSKLQTYRQLVSEAGFNPDQAQVVVSGPFRFLLKRCAREPGSVNCELLVENREDQKHSIFFSPEYYMGGRFSHLADASGNRYWANRSGNRQAELLPGVPVRASLQFDNVPPGVRQGTIVVEADQGFLGREMTVIFRNIAFD